MPTNQTDNLSPNEPAEQPRENMTTLSEREALIKAIVTEMRKDALKCDVSLQLRKTSRAQAISNFLKHDAVLVFIGFVVTGLMGGWIANRWQRQEWNRQQTRLLVIRRADRKLEISNEITKAVGERNASALGVLRPLDEEELNDKQLTLEEVDRVQGWNKVSAEWITNYQVLSGEIAVNITDPEVARLFEDIVEKEKYIGAKVNVVRLSFTYYRQANNKEAQKYLNDIHSLLEQTAKELMPLVKKIAKEADDDIINEP